jgi:hypothetical protein
MLYIEPDAKMKPLCHMDEIESGAVSTEQPKVSVSIILPHSFWQFDTEQDPWMGNLVRGCVLTCKSCRPCHTRAKPNSDMAGTLVAGHLWGWNCGLDLAQACNKSHTCTQNPVSLIMKLTAVQERPSPHYQRSDHWHATVAISTGCLSAGTNSHI